MKLRLNPLNLLFLFLILFPLLDAFPHSGRTNVEGCHNNRKNGDYHCHNTKKRSAPRRTTPSPQLPSPRHSQGYDRKNWQHWLDVDGDCQNSRTEILIRDSVAPMAFESAGNCRVVAGEWLGPYTGKRFHTAQELDIDHIVSLKHAYESGAMCEVNSPRNCLPITSRIYSL